MDKKKTVLFFTAPSGTGKNLYRHMLGNNRKLLHVDAKFHNVSQLPAITQDVCIFTQLLSTKHALVGRLIYGKSHCLAFSPIMDGDGGTSTANCGFKYTHFRPFNDNELVTYAKVCKVDVVKEVKENYNTLQFPQIFDQCPTRESVIQWFHHQLHDTFRKLEGRQEQQPQAVVKIQKVLMKASLGQPLERSEEAVALSCGRFYQGDDSKPKLACPPNIVLEHVHLEVMGTYRMYDEGAALEFLVAAQLQRCHNNNEIACLGQHPSSLRDKLRPTPCKATHCRTIKQLNVQHTYTFSILIYFHKSVCILCCHITVPSLHSDYMHSSMPHMHTIKFI